MHPRPGSAKAGFLFQGQDFCSICFRLATQIAEVHVGFVLKAVRSPSRLAIHHLTLHRHCPHAPHDRVLHRLAIHSLLRQPCSELILLIEPLCQRA